MVLLVLVILAGVALVNLNGLINRNKDYLLAQAKEALGRDVKIGDIGVTLWGGIGVRLQKPQLAAGRVNVNFTLPGTKLAMKFLGQLAWQDKQGNAGIRFVDAAPRMKRDLQLWLERQYFTS